jgi:hypothetical protein
MTHRDARARESGKDEGPSTILECGRALPSRSIGATSSNGPVQFRRHESRSLSACRSSATSYAPPERASVTQLADFVMGVAVSLSRTLARAQAAPLEGGRAIVHRKSKYRSNPRDLFEMHRRVPCALEPGGNGFRGRSNRRHAKSQYAFGTHDDARRRDECMR